MGIPFKITATRQFAAEHALRMYNGKMEQMHDHLWRVKVTVGAEKLDGIGVVMDFHVLERAMDEAIVRLAGGRMNELEDFASVNPSAEQVAVYIAKTLKLPRTISLVHVEVWETADNSAIYTRDPIG